MNLERFWHLLGEGNVDSLLAPACTWDDPLFDAAAGDAVRREAVPRLSGWLRERASDGGAQHFRTTADAKRVVVEHVIRLKDGLVWNQAEQKAEKAPLFELATAIVGERADDAFGALRIYFGTWSVTGGAPRVRVGPICPDERAATKEAMNAMPTVRAYFDMLAKGDASMADLFEPDGYFREPANNFACGRDQLVAHFTHILAIGGVGIEFLTATREGDRLGIELQTVQWGKKKMNEPQAGFAIYELGPHGKMQGARVYDSVVPPL
jgi:hypothetical protein